ncbi:periplasmic nitrate reductase, NapE protein [Neptunomonas sp. XY-337]|uniref:periplasmic nitrate reductase, NapE protein n=1 Tax=Neptunomonas sp. XY-337 TaxID=2561897 RepID=UPI0010AB095E|nr:periplasmic nitrate reductase, NapE protein [Neptunomonas sp. XY-337]
MNDHSDNDDVVSFGDELQAFILIAAVAIPLLTVALIAGYGFVIWMSQLFLGPPGH